MILIINKIMKKSKKQNFIKSLWNGNESLGTSFWAVYFIGGSIVSIPAWVLPETSNALLFFVPFQLTYITWAIVGTWRSASKFKPKKKQWAWGTISQVYIVLSIIRILVSIAGSLN